jgi:hypothetical protein
VVVVVVVVVVLVMAVVVILLSCHFIKERMESFDSNFNV